MSGSPARSDTVMRVGVAITLAGVVLSLIAMLPLVIADLEMPSAWWFLSVPTTGVGVIVVCVGLVMSARERRRSARTRPLG